MKVLVRCVRTRKYFKAGKVWTEQKADAHDFQTTRNVISAEQLQDSREPLEIIFTFGDQRFDIVIPLQRMTTEPVGLSRPKRSKDSKPRNVKKRSHNHGNVGPLPGPSEDRGGKAREKRKC
jgi:hypothetical protein